uniref:Myb/SANT-like DNA-binding domain-containing protein n=1 Tax=Chelonoidis abingdonii TaxID=106734 RepID=A0A8C0JBA9_CHEAB
MPKHLKKVSKDMKDRGYNRDSWQCRVKIKELRQAYQKNREANGHSGSLPQTCCFYDELHAILGGAATSTPILCFDSVNGVGCNMEAGFVDKENKEEVEDSSQQGSGETGFLNSQARFLTLDLEPVTPECTQALVLKFYCLLTQTPKNKIGGPLTTQPLHPRGLPKQQNAGIQ